MEEQEFKAICNNFHLLHWRKILMKTLIGIRTQTLLIKLNVSICKSKDSRVKIYMERAFTLIKPTFSS